jgi:hypothetical protein
MQLTLPLLASFMATAALQQQPCTSRLHTQDASGLESYRASLALWKHLASTARRLAAIRPLPASLLATLTSSQQHSRCAQQCLDVQAVSNIQGHPATLPVAEHPAIISCAGLLLF